MYPWNAASLILQARLPSPLNQGVREILELGPGDLHVQVLGSTGVRGDEGEVDVRLGGGGELALSLLRRLPKPLHGELVLEQVDALLLLELVGHVVQQDVVKVLSSQEGVSVCGLDLKHTPRDLQDGNVEGATAKVEHGDEPFLLVHAVAQGSGSGLVDDPQNVQA